jgi:hypothetical protein
MQTDNLIAPDMVSDKKLVVFLVFLLGNESGIWFREPSSPLAQQPTQTRGVLPSYC